MQYLEYRLCDLKQIWQDVTKGPYVCFSGVLTSYLIQNGSAAAILDLALHAISQTPLEGFEPNLAQCHKGSLTMFWLSFDLLT